MYDQTQTQDSEEQRKAQQLSLQRWRPPIDVPGYEPRRFLGAGAYGEVWVAIDRNTGRQVAIKFYAHRGGLDWSILSREVEKLAFLSADRYVVQLLDVGWNSTPAYYVMEYVERGSLEDRLRNEGPLSVDQAVNLFRDVATGLVHAHDKGVLHCDLKPANILIDHEGRPRIADFGQSRLSHEQQPALGTLFYMAPEQADLKATPDARWDVYALGALLYTMLTGSPPHRKESAAAQVGELEQAGDLGQRLEQYRRLIMSSAPPAEHRRVAGMDRGLADIIDRCVAADPKRRFPNVQSVLHALDERTRRRARRPMVALGAFGPAALLAIVALMAGRWLSLSVDQSSRALTGRALESLGFAADSVAAVAANEMERRFEAVEKVANDPKVVELMEQVAGNAALQKDLAALSEPNTPEAELKSELNRIRRPTGRPADPLPDDGEPSQASANDARYAEVVGLERRLYELMRSTELPRQRSWFITSASGVQLVRFDPSETTGRNFAWRTYFHGGTADHAEDWRAPADQHIVTTQLSAPYKSQSTDDWSVAVSTPVFGGDDQFLGVVAVSFDVGRDFFDLNQKSPHRFAVLADMRPGEHQGLLVQHPLYYEVANEDRDRLENHRLAPANAYPNVPRTVEYRDPMGSDPQGTRFAQRWLAAQSPVIVRDSETGWVVIVQEAYDAAIGESLDELRASFRSTGLITLLIIAVVLGLLWAFVIKSLSSSRSNPSRPTASGPTPASPHVESA